LTGRLHGETPIREQAEEEGEGEAVQDKDQEDHVRDNEGAAGGFQRAAMDAAEERQPVRARRGKSPAAALRRAVFAATGVSFFDEERQPPQGFF